MSKIEPQVPGGLSLDSASLDINGAPIVSGRFKATSARRGALEAGVARALSASIERASWSQCRALGSFLGLAFFAAGSKKRSLAVDNVSQALGLSRAQSLRIARRSAQNWGMTTCEFLRSPVATKEDIDDYVSLRGIEHLETALAAGKGAIIVTAHIGNWELLAARIARHFRAAGIVRPLSNATAQNLMSSVRRAYDLGLISKNAAGRPSIKVLQNNGVLIILPDRHAGASGELLPLFGRATRFENAPARLALMSGAPILMACGARRAPWLSQGSIDAYIAPAFLVEAASKSERASATTEGTKRVIAGLENMVAQYPDQWSWMLRRWRENDMKEDSKNSIL